MAASGAVFAALAILTLAAAAGVGFAHRPHADDGTPAGKTARTKAQARFDDEEAEDEPSFGMVSIGAVDPRPSHRQGGAAQALPPPPGIRGKEPGLPHFPGLPGRLRRGCRCASTKTS